ncbi:MAG TPA: hypothetical protein VLG44_00515, partial [Chlamydiales bacterium]|nr:hypothetical protein [Chlamydiales bacterium]
GVFLGIVGDQGMPDSGYAFPFFGRKAWTSTAPAILAYKTGSPIMVATTRRKKGKYHIHYSEPLWPDLSKPMDEEIIRLMNASLAQLQESIKKSPGEWLWQHNRFKQHVNKVIQKSYRWDSICIILPPEKEEFEKLLPHLKTLKNIYASDFLFVIIPTAFEHQLNIECDEKILYNKIEDALVNDFRFKLVFNFTKLKKIKKHYLKLSAFHVLTLEDLKKIAYPYKKTSSLSDILKKALCKQGFS